MIRPFVIGIVILGSVLVSAQSSSPEADQSAAAIACPVETGPPPTTPHNWIAVSAAVAQGYKIAGKPPKYPSDAKKAHVDGTVVLRVTISDSGDVEDVCVSQGPSMLQQAAFDAVKGWKYKPYVLDGMPREVRTHVNVVFYLTR